MNVNISWYLIRSVYYNISQSHLLVFLFFFSISKKSGIYHLYLPNLGESTRSVIMKN